MAQVMLEYFIAFAHLGTILSLFMIIRGCYGIKQEIPIQGGEISGRIEQTAEQMSRTAELIDEVAQLISDFTDSVPTPSPKAGSDSPFGLILNSLLNRAPMEEEYGPTQEWTVPETKEYTPTQEANA